MLEPEQQRREQTIAIGARLLEQRRGAPAGTLLERRAGAQRLYAPANATRMLERTIHKLAERAREQSAIGERRIERERRADRLGGELPRDRLDRFAGCEFPESPARASELRRHGILGQRRELTQRANAEHAEPAMRVDVEGEHGDGLRSEKLLFFPRSNDERLSWLGSARRS